MEATPSHHNSPGAAAVEAAGSASHHQEDNEEKFDVSGAEPHACFPFPRRSHALTRLPHAVPAVGELGCLGTAVAMHYLWQATAVGTRPQPLLLHQPLPHPK